jgi:hypothetical protein
MRDRSRSRGRASTPKATHRHRVVVPANAGTHFDRPGAIGDAMPWILRSPGRRPVSLFASQPKKRCIHPGSHPVSLCTVRFMHRMRQLPADRPFDERPVTPRRQPVVNEGNPLQ